MKLIKQKVGEIEINFSKVVKDHDYCAYFSIEVDGIASQFNISDVRKNEEHGVYVIHLSKYNKVAKHVIEKAGLKKGAPLDLSISNEQRDELFKINEAEIKKVKEAAEIGFAEKFEKAERIKAHFFTTGYGSVSHLSLIDAELNEFESDILNNKFGPVNDMIKERHLSEIEKFAISHEFNDGDYSLDRTFVFDKNVLLKEAEKFRDEQIEKEKTEKEAREKEKKEAAQTKEQAFEKELWIFGDELLSRSGGMLLHSLAASITKEKISIFTVGHVRFMKDKNPNTTFSIKGVLKESGYQWNANEKVWETEYSEDNVKKTIEILEKFDTKADPNEYKLVRCWECGSWGYASEMKLDGPGYYCGC